MQVKNEQFALSLIKHEVEQASINQRAYDGYINATALCEAADKEIHDYLKLETTKDFCEKLSLNIGIEKSKLIHRMERNEPELQGIWVHPQIAIHLGQWASPEFAIEVTKWVFDWMAGKAANRYKIPYHIKRYALNQSKVPPTHFSMLNQMIVKLLAPLELEGGYVIPTGLMPDISLGMMFSKWCRNNGRNPEKFPKYIHVFGDGRRPPVFARLYPNELLTDFNLHLENWILSGKALEYFAEKDPDSIEPMKKVMKRIEASKKIALEKNFG